MSLYNMLFGVNPLAGVLMKALNISAADVPRFRDCYLDNEGGKMRIAIHTRTGGGNRDFYDCEERCRANYPEYYFDGSDERPTGPWNADLRALPGFLYDEDDDFDCTYATFYYDIPEEFRPIITTLGEVGAAAEKPAERWQKVLTELRSGSDTPEAKRALEVGEQIFAQISAALAPCDRSGEADKTEGLGPKGESTVPKGEAQ